MPEIAKYVLMHNPTKNGRRWGAAISRDGGDYRYVSAWGPAVGSLQHKFLSVESAWDAEARFEGSHWPKSTQGYVAFQNNELHTLLENLCAQPFPNSTDKTNLTLGQINQMAKQAAQPIADTVTGCGFCALKKRPSSDPWWKAPCTICSKRPWSGHAAMHPHKGAYEENKYCTQFSLTPTQWTSYGYQPGKGLVGSDQWVSQLPDEAVVDGCPMCVIYNRYPYGASLREELNSESCRSCKQQLRAHGGWHPHKAEWCSCTGAVFTGVAYGLAGISMPTRMRIEEITVVKPDPIDADLANLPCDCEHLLSYHTAKEELLASGITLSANACLLVTCHCESYRRTCKECGELTRTRWRHKESCLTGLREKLLYGDAQPITKARYVRQPRQIGHLLLPDDE